MEAVYEKPMPKEAREGAANQTFHNNNRAAIREKLKKDFPRGNFPYPVIDDSSPLPVTSTPGTTLEYVKENALREIKIDNEHSVPLIDFVNRSGAGVVESQVFKQTELYKDVFASNSQALHYFMQLSTKGLISQESSWNNVPISNKSARGLWQMQEGFFNDVVERYNVGNTTFEEVLGESILAKYDPESIQKQAKIAMLSFDMSYAFLKNKLGENHWLFKEKDPRKILIPLLIHCHNAGRARIGAMIEHFDKIYPAYKIPEKFGKRGEYNDDLFLFMCCNYYGSKAKHAEGYKKDSIQYTPKIQAWNYLLNLKTAPTKPKPKAPDEKNSEIKPNQGIETDTYTEALRKEYALVNARFIEAVQGGVKIRDKDPKEFNALSQVKLNPSDYQDNRTPLTLADFLESSSKNPSHNQTEVTKWLNANDKFWSKYSQGLATDAELLDEINRLKAGGNPKLRNLVEKPHLSTYIEKRQPHGVAEEWRRVIRVDHLPIMNELNLRVNELLRKRGMSEDYFVSILINSTVRSKEKNKAVGGSDASAHMRFSAWDISENFYMIHKFNDDGSVSRYRNTGDMKKFLDAVKIVLRQMALEGKVKVRYHDAHFHVVPMVPTSY